MSTKSKYADVLNALSDMQESPAYAARKNTLANAEQTIVMLEKQRDNAWQELRQIREAIEADSDESTLDEVRRVVAQRNQLRTDFANARTA